MSQRTAKVASLIKQVVGAELVQLPEAARLTVTSVDVTPDLRNATVYIGVLASTEAGVERMMNSISPIKHDIQDAVARKLATKFTPRLSFERDVGGQYADHITRVIRGL